MATEEIQEEAARLRARQALGRSQGLNRLFDYLVNVASSEARPKEFEVAAAVFGRDSSFDGQQDASVRVAVHRLRRKLEEFYAGPGRDDPVRLSIPKGEYRMVAEPRPDALPIEIPGLASGISPRMGLAVAIGLIAVINLAVLGAFWMTHTADWELGRVRRSPVWAPILKADMPTLLVLGDYYIFGETDEAAGVDRLVREYAINNRGDLDAWLMENPKAMGRYRDLDLYYLPIGAAFALRSIVPVLTGGSAKPGALHIVMASDLTPEMLKSNNIVYLGYLSGLGVLRAPVFAGSRFAVGETYDEIVDVKTGKTYVSQEGGPSKGESSQRDFGYVTAFRGPQGNRILIIAGARDVALMQAAEAISTPAALATLKRAQGGGDSFEALYEAQGIRRSNLNGRLIVSAPRSRVNPWNAESHLNFPAG